MLCNQVFPPWFPSLFSLHIPLPLITSPSLALFFVFYHKRLVLPKVEKHWKTATKTFLISKAQNFCRVQSIVNFLKNHFKTSRSMEKYLHDPSLTQSQLH